jgi:DNA-binding transcriptional LysR family regulator
MVYVDQVARSGSIQRAAKELNIAASAVDRQILLLEAELGVALFERLPRGMRLTPAGDVVVGLARRWRGDVRRLAADLKHVQGVEQGHLRIVAMDSHATSIMPGFLARLSTEHPRVTVEVEITSTDSAMQSLVAAEADFGAVFNLPPHRDLQVMWSAPLPLGCIVAPDHVLAKQASVTLQRVTKFPLVVQSRALVIRRYLEARHGWVLKQGGQPPVTTNSLHLVKMLARSGRFVAFTSELDAAPELAAGTLAFVPVRDSAAEPQTITVAANAGRHMPRIAQAAIALLAEEIAATLATVRRAAN